MTSSRSIRTFHDSRRRWTLHQGDVLHVLPTISSSLYDATFFDAPYGINFMEQGWDSAVPPVEVWKSLLRVCKPGALLLAFGGTKTFHRLVSNIEDAGWEIRDTICWLYGEGFPKGLDIGKAIDKELGVERPVVGEKQNLQRGRNADHRFGFRQSECMIPITTPGSEQSKIWNGYSTALKPAWEPILLAQKPRRGSYAANALRFGCGGLNIGECRIGTKGGIKRSHQAAYPRLEDGEEDRRHWSRVGHAAQPLDKGRWPANVMLDEEAAAELDRRTGKSRSRRGKRRCAESNIGNGRTLNSFRSRVDAVEGFEDEGGVSRFFYVAKAGRRERKGNDHPTVKPLGLCEYLARLILPPKRKTPRRLLVPFSGSGSEILGALSAGWDHVTGIEREAKYVEIARRRLSEFDDGFSVAA